MSEGVKILVIQTAFPGDAILTMPFIQELKRKNAKSTIDVLCIPSTSEIFSSSPAVDNVIVLDKRGDHKGFLKFIKFVRNLKQNKYQMVFSPHRSFRSALITLQLSADNSVGFENSSLPFMFKKTIPYDYTVHEVERNLRFISDDYSGEKWKIIPKIFVSEESKLNVKTLLNANNLDRFISIAPGSVWETKKYPAEYFKEIINHFTKSYYKVVLIGGEKDRALCESLAAGYQNNVFTSAGTFSFVETVQLLKSSSLLICNDSAPTHLGVSAEIPVLTIYCSTTSKFGFYPYNQGSDYISYDDLICKPCGIHGYQACPLDHFNCGKLLLPKLVISKAELILKNAG